MATLSTLSNFNGSNGSLPYDGLSIDPAGDLFGTTEGGGANNDGTVFEIPKTASGYGALITLASFNGANGETPVGGGLLNRPGPQDRAERWQGCSLEFRCGPQRRGRFGRRYLVETPPRLRCCPR